MEISTLLIDEKFLQAAQYFVAGAKKSIYISTFKAETSRKPRGTRLNQFFDTVIEKSRLGLDTRLLINKRENFCHIPLTNEVVIQKLKANKVKVRYLPYNRLCHAKIIVVDSTAAILGSHNLSVKSCHYNFEVSLLTYCERLTHTLHGLFLHTWENSKDA